MSKYTLMNNSTLLSQSSWLWIDANKNKKDEECHVLFIELFEVFEFEGNLNKIAEQIAEWKDQYGPDYDNLLVETVCFNLGCGETESKMFLVGKRMETEQERDLRLETDNRAKEAREKERQSKIQCQKDAEYRNFLELKSKYEKETK